MRSQGFDMMGRDCPSNRAVLPGVAVAAGLTASGRPKKPVTEIRGRREGLLSHSGLLVWVFESAGDLESPPIAGLPFLASG